MKNKIWCSHLEGVFPISYVIGAKEKPFIITEDIHYVLNDGTKYIVPKGFRLDGTSSPRFVRSIVPRLDDRIVGSTLHDHMYYSDFMRGVWTDRMAKDFADSNMTDFHNLVLPKEKRLNKIMNFIVDKLGWKIFKEEKE